MRRDGAAIDFCEFSIVFRVEPASLEIAPLKHDFTHSNNESISRKIKSLQERDKFLQEQVDEAQRAASEAQERINERVGQVLLYRSLCYRSLLFYRSLSQKCIDGRVGQV